jgi:hypothetical protein
MPQIATRELTGPQRRTVAALLTAGSIEAAATAAGVSRNTVFRWLQEDAFRVELARARARLFDETMMQLQEVMRESVRVLAGLLKSRNEGVRARAAGLALGLGMKAAEAVDLSERVRRLEDINEGKE